MSFRLEQLLAGKKVMVFADSHLGRWPLSFELRMDKHQRIVLERWGNYYRGPDEFGFVDALPARLRKIKVVADNPGVLAKLFGAVYDNSLFE